MKRLNLFATVILFSILTISINVLASPGGLDPTFSGDGKNTFNLAGIANASDVAIDSNGVIYTAGYASNYTNELLITSFKQNGNLNTSFGTNGYVMAPILDDTFAYAIALQNNGKIVVGGRTDDGNDFNMFVSRFNTDGTFDNSFGNGGTRILSLSPSTDIIRDIVIQPNGSILATGTSYINGKQYMVLVRYLAEGSYDYSFGTAGIVKKRIDRNNNYSRSIALAPTGEIYQVGYAGSSGNTRFAVLRYKPDGSMDHSFGNSGVVQTNISNNSDIPYAVAVQSDNKIVVAGAYDFIYPGYYSKFAMVRYLPNGSIDTSFSINGYALINDGSNKSRFSGLAIQSDGKIIASGYSYHNNSYRYAVVRVNSNGWLDQTWGYNGFSYADFGLGNGHDKSYSMALNPSGKPVLVGSAGDYWLGVARFYNDTPPL